VGKSPKSALGAGGRRFKSSHPDHPYSVARAIRETPIKLRPASVLVVLAVLLAAPLAAEGQQAGKMPRIGILVFSPPETVAFLFRGIEEGLRDLGYVEGRNIVFERRYADGKAERLPDLAAELVRLKVDVIVAANNRTIDIARKATTQLPIVMVHARDPVPVGSGFVRSLPRPGGNITGLTLDVGFEIDAKRLQLPSLRPASSTDLRL
jgi:ABC-type uncharacterized transport system substrate-binding protein